MLRAGASGIAHLDRHGISDVLLDQFKDVAVSAGRVSPLVLRYTRDIADSESVNRMRAAVVEAFANGLNLVVNNAAAQEPMGTILDIDPDVYWQTWSVNVRGLFNMARALLPELLEYKTKHNGLCTMLNVASAGGLEPRPGGASYRTSKLAVIWRTEHLALDHGKQGLLTYCVGPGAIRTKLSNHLPPQIRDRLPHDPNVAGVTFKERLACRAICQLPVGYERVGEQESW